MKIAIGADHAGFQLKAELAAHLHSQGHDIKDVGTSSDEAVDYPIFARAVALSVAEGRCERGIVIDGAGIGSAMVANKIPGVRAALAYDLSSAVNSREHNDANVLALGAGLIGPALARQIVDVWIPAKCQEERHLRRVALIEAIERETAAGQQGVPGREVSLSGVRVPEVNLDEVSEADLARIARRLEELLGGPSISKAPDTARHFLGLGAERLSTGPGPGRIPEDIASYIDHTLLRPDATEEEIRALCAEAREFRFAAVCVNPTWAKLVTRELKGSGVTTCSVVGFPFGATHPETKAQEARRAIRDGAREIDMVIHIGALKDGNDPGVLADIRAVVEACRDGSARCKVIIETALLTDAEKRRACQLARRARAHFVKTSTGFGPGGATAEDVALMATEVRGAGIEIKASGGIRSYQVAKSMIEAGATRIGASAGVAIVEGARGVAATV